MNAPRELLLGVLERRLETIARTWLSEGCAEVAQGAPGARFPTLISQASRRVPRGPLAPDEELRAAAHELVPGWNPERWSLVDAARAALVLSRPDLDRPVGKAALEESFRYADVGELVALYRTAPLLPDPSAWVWRVGEGCRSSMRAVFEAAACDSPFAFRHFDDVGWRQLCIKAVFVEAPLWRVFGLDQRIDAELARMALDLVDERRSAGRRVPVDLWLCLGRHSGERGAQSLELELGGDFPAGRRAAAIALARSGGIARLAGLRRTERDAAVAATMDLALKGRIHQGAWQDFETAE